MGIPTLWNLGGTGKGLLGYGGADKFNRQTADRSPLDSNSFNLPHFNRLYGRYEGIADERRDAPLGAYSDFRGGQQQLITQLQDQAAGHGPGQQLVARHAQENADATLRAQLAAAQSARPGQGASAAFNAAQAGGMAQSAVGGQRVMGGLQAQLNAFGQLGGALEGARGADENMNMFNARQTLDARGLDDQRQMEALRQALAASQAQQQGRIGYEQTRAGINASNPTGWERFTGAVQGAIPFLGMGGGGGGGAQGGQFTPPQGVPWGQWGPPGQPRYY